MTAYLCSLRCGWSCQFQEWDNDMLSVPRFCCKCGASVEKGQCPECGGSLNLSGNGLEPYEFQRFCPACGARTSVVEPKMHERPTRFFVEDLKRQLHGGCTCVRCVAIRKEIEELGEAP